VAVLKPPDSHHASAASGWLELGNPREAAAELDRVSPAHRGHPAVLELSWRIHAEEKRWQAALEVATQLIQTAPERPTGWIDQSFALHELQRTREAWEVLLPVAGRFPKTSIIPYNLACYACQMGNHAEARRWLAKAIKLRTQDDIKQLALADKDLEPLWAEIKDW
jgi:predicted Zn-dependent protease